MLTVKQAEALAFIERYIRDNDGLSPMLAEIAAGLGLHTEAGASVRIRPLIKRGYVRRVPGQHRGIEVIKSLRGKITPHDHVCPNCGSALSISVDARAA